MSSVTSIQDRQPNFFSGGKLYLVRCFICDPEVDRENYAPAIATGCCNWCGWSYRSLGHREAGKNTEYASIKLTTL